jgi:hypothetical protein
MESSTITNLTSLTELYGMDKLVKSYNRCNVNVKTQNITLNLNETQLSALEDENIKAETISVFSYGLLKLCNPSHMFEDSNIETFTSKGDVILSGDASYMFQMATFF